MLVILEEVRLSLRLPGVLITLLKFTYLSANGNDTTEMSLNNGFISQILRKVLPLYFNRKSFPSTLYSIPSLLPLEQVLSE